MSFPKMSSGNALGGFPMREHTYARSILFSTFMCLLLLWMVACGGPNPNPQSNAPAAPPDKQVLRLPIGARLLFARSSCERCSDGLHGCQFDLSWPGATQQRQLSGARSGCFL